MKKVALIVAGGSGTRMGSDIPKQFLLLKGKPILMHTIDKFYRFDNEIRIILVLPNNQVDYWKVLCNHHGFYIDHEIAEGGETRFQSVKNGLAIIDKKNVQMVAIHDGVRPLVSYGTIDRCFKKTEEAGNALPVVDVTESVRIVQKDPRKNEVANRAKVKLVQTPQVFRSDILLTAFKQDYKEKFTDDATVVENIGYTINLVEGNRENIKITNGFDLAVANAIMDF